MPEFFGVSFITPAFLMLIPAILAGLFYAYRRGGKGREIIVSTVFLLKELAGVPKTRQKFWPPPRFFLELLCLLALVFAAAGISSQKFEDKFTLLIDNSLSMSARVESLADSTLLGIAKRDAVSYLSSLSGDKGVKVCTTSPIVKCLNDRFVSLGAARETLEDISIAHGEDKIDEAISSLLLDPSEPQVVVFSDKSLPENSKLNPKVSVRSTSELTAEMQNIAILGGQIDTGKSAGTIKLSINLAAFTISSNSVNLRVESIEEVEGAFTTNILAERSLDLSAGDSIKVDFELPKAPAYKTSLILRQPLPANSLAEDDVAFFVPDLSSGKARLVSDFSANDLGLNKVATLSFEDSTLANYEDNLDGVDFVIFHKVVPDKLPGVSSVFINPEKGLEFFDVKPSVKNTTKNIEITSWDEVNSITAYLKMAILKFSEVSPLMPKRGGSAVVTSNAGSIIVSLEANESRYVATGFEMLPYVAGRSPALSILTLNIFKWLSGHGVSVGFAEGPFVIGREFSEIIDLISSKSFESGALLDIPGVYKTLYQDKRPSQLIALNFFSENESDKLTKQTFVLPTTENRLSVVGESAASFAPLIILAICILVSLDLVLQIISGVRRRYNRV